MFTLSCRCISLYVINIAKYVDIVKYSERENKEKNDALEEEENSASIRAKDVRRRN
jgi:hypothetical protein